ncbi:MULTISPECIES: hypothetical protein [Lactiplantibacillus]|uniref:hypothetical protein n=1 Tax=Lactiplantibacillus TaxID=2767842 RepID=UPI000BB0287E|nr:hypothetical protein [Lactiplantibacillus plantarum]ASZ34675.1 hypothetical protein CLC99_15995 [Lactiplantibacillus plantarum]
MKGKIIITIDDDGYTVDAPSRSYNQLMADLAAATIFTAHLRLRRYELIRLIKRFWKKYKDVEFSSY